MSDTAERDRNRAERRARKPAPSIREQRFVNLVLHLFDTERRAATSSTSEPPDARARRLRRTAARVQHEQRRAHRRAIRAARRANR